MAQMESQLKELAAFVAPTMAVGLARSAPTEITLTGTVSCGHCQGIQPMHKGYTQYTWALNSVSQGDDIVLVGKDQVYKLQGVGGSPWDPEWDQIVEKALPAEMLSALVPKDVLRFCPRFYGMQEADKRVFWAYFFQALAGAEAGLNPTTSVRHTEPGVTKRDEVRGTAARTEGLLQLAYADKSRYGCDFDWETDRKLKQKIRPNHSPAEK